MYEASWIFDWDRSSLVGRLENEGSLKDLFVLLDVAFPARFLQKLSLYRVLELNMSGSLTSEPLYDEYAQPLPVYSTTVERGADYMKGTMNEDICR